MRYRGFGFSVCLLIITVCLVGLILPAKMSSQSSDVDNEIDVVAPPEDCEVSAELSVTMDDCPPPICYGPTDEIVPCDDTQEPPLDGDGDGNGDGDGDGNGNGDGDGICEGDIFESGMRPQVDPVTCEPICYGPVDQRVPCDDRPGPIRPDPICAGFPGFTDKSCPPFPKPVCVPDLCPPPGSDCEVFDYFANSRPESTSSITVDPCWPLNRNGASSP